MLSFCIGHSSLVTPTCAGSCITFCYRGIAYVDVKILFYHLLKAHHLNTESVSTVNSNVKSHAEHPDPHTSHVEISMLSGIWLLDLALLDLLENWRNTTVPVFGLLYPLYSRTVIKVPPMQSKKTKR